MMYAQLLCLICFLLEVHFQTGNVTVLPLTQSLGMRLGISFILPRSDIICKCFVYLQEPMTLIHTAQIRMCMPNNLYLTNTTQQYWPLSLHLFLDYIISSVALLLLMQCSIIANGGHSSSTFRFLSTFENR